MLSQAQITNAKERESLPMDSTVKQRQATRGSRRARKTNQMTRSKYHKLTFGAENEKLHCPSGLLKHLASILYNIIEEVRSYVARNLDL